MKENKNWILFKSVFVISAFTIGGGYVIVPLLQKKFVDDLQWIDEKEMLDMVAISQSAPGVIAVNAAVILGQKISGIKGALIAVLGTVLPPFIILSIISLFYEAFRSNEYIAVVLEGMQAAVAAIIVAAALGMFKGILDNNKVYNLIIFSIAFILAFFFKISVVYLIIGAIILALLSHFIKKGAKV